MPSRDSPFAALAGFLLDLALIAMLLFMWINAAAPPQDLPWKPLRLSDPVGLATRAKLMLVISSPERCLAFLQREQARFTPVRSPVSSGPCVVPGPVRLADQLQPRAPLMSCPLALTYLIWSQHEVQPAAERILGARLTAVEHAGTYACRGVRGASTASVDVSPSLHAKAAAIDIAGFRLADGQSVSIGRDWKGSGPKSRFLHEVHDSACSLFHTTLSPDYNAAHRSHFHLDMGGYSICR